MQDTSYPPQVLETTFLQHLDAAFGAFLRTNVHQGDRHRVAHMLGAATGQRRLYAFQHHGLPYLARVERAAGADRDWLEVDLDPSCCSSDGVAAPLGQVQGTRLLDPADVPAQLLAEYPAEPGTGTVARLRFDSRQGAGAVSLSPPRGAPPACPGLRVRCSFRMCPE